MESRCLEVWYPLCLPASDFTLFPRKLSLKILQIALFVRPLFHPLNQTLQILFEIWIETEIESVVVWVENRAVGDGVEEGGDKVGIMDLKG